MDEVLCQGKFSAFGNCAQLYTVISCLQEVYAEKLRSKWGMMLCNLKWFRTINMNNDIIFT